MNHGETENPPARTDFGERTVRGDQVDSQQGAGDLASLCLGDASCTLSHASGTTDEDLRDLLTEIGRDPKAWRGRAGQKVGRIIAAEAHAMAPRWQHAGGTIDGLAVGAAWEEVMRDRERLATDHVASPLAAVRCAVARAYAAEVGAIQTGMGDPVRKRAVVRTIVSHHKDAGRLGTVELDPGRLTGATAEPGDRLVAPWAAPLAALLNLSGWAWPAPAGSCLLAVEADVARTRRREAPGAALAATGVPAATWSALALLVAGSGPGCAVENRWPGAKALFAAGGSRALRASAEVQRIVDAAVAGAAVRSGRIAVRSDSLAGAA